MKKRYKPRQNIETVYFQRLTFGIAMRLTSFYLENGFFKNCKFLDPRIDFVVYYFPLEKLLCVKEPGINSHIDFVLTETIKQTKQIKGSPWTKNTI